MSKEKKEELKRERLSRRDFLKNAGIMTAGTAVGAGFLLSGCSQDAQGGTEAKPQAAEAKPWLPEKWDKETDVVVVGTGCGLAAAIEAKNAGADVIILEKNDWVGGLYKTAGGHAILGGTRIQKEAGMQDSLEDWFEDEMKASGYRGVPELIRTYVERGPELIEWMESMGFKWYPTVGNSSPEVHRVGRSHYPAANPDVYDAKPNSPMSFGLAWTTVWEKKLQEMGVPILFKHRMKKVYREPGGPVLGVSAETPEGTINIKARKGVILCTGTWTDNHRMAQAWDPRVVGPDCFGDGGTPADGTLFVDSAGDGHFAAAEVGAGFSDMSFTSYIYLFYGSRSYWGWEPPDFKTAAYYADGKGIPRPAAFFERVILVKNDGVRYINEMEGARKADPAKGEAGSINENPEWPYTAKYLSLPHPRNVWAIADSESAAALKWPIEDLKNPNPKKGLMFDPACIAIADSIPELAEKMGIPAAELEKTISRYNGFVGAGKDEDFGKTALFKIAKPPFYGLKASLIRHTQRNGVRVNTKSQVIEQADQLAGYSGKAVDESISIDQEKVIPHLYAAGELGNVMGWRRPHGSLGNYATVARIAGENAAKESSWE
ncbi:secreted protein [Desulfitobacterium sp. LBE]|nr:FAD-dependent oxidoreductase [Desulfitobacterium sp. LBE]TWH56637.1 secreted protein [Desulfitobacterium sp. LBE]